MKGRDSPFPATLQRNAASDASDDEPHRDRRLRALPPRATTARDAIILFLASMAEQRAQGVMVIETDEGEFGLIQLHGGAIMWIEFTDELAPLTQRLASQGGLAATAVRAALDECDPSSQRLRAGLMETAHLDESQLREAVRVLLGHKLARLLSARDAAVTFVTDPVVGLSRYCFTLEELVR